MRASKTRDYIPINKNPSSRPKPLLPLITPKRVTADYKPADASSDPNEGFLQLVEKGDLPPTFDLERALTTGGPMKALRAPLHSGVASRMSKQQQLSIMTETSGYSRMKGYKLDYSEIEKLPTKLNLTELKAWEEEEAAYSQSSPTTSSTAAPTADASEVQRDDARTYTELLDLYSMHEFIIRKGKTLRNTPEFASFKRHYLSSWGNIERLIQTLEEFLKSYGVEVGYIDGKKLATLASYQLDGYATQRDLLECVANYEDVEPFLGDISQQYNYGVRGHDLAAAKIQSVWRMHKQRIAYTHLVIGTRAATIIQQQWAIHRAHCVTRRVINTVRETRLTRWRQTMEEFIKRWPRIRSSKRTVIHIPSLSYPSFHAKNIPFYFVRQLGQLTRLCDLADPNVELVFVAPFKPETEVLEYYYTLLADAGVSNVAGRLTFLVPEDVSRLPEGMSLTRLVLLSARLMKLLSALATGKPAFIVPGVLGPEELTMATMLNLPLLSPEPRVAQVFGTKSGCQRLLESAGVTIPPGVTQLRSSADLLRALATLMIEHREVPRWLIKLDTEAGSRGHAYFDTSRMKSLKAAAAGRDAPRFESVLQELEEFGDKRARLVHPGCYADWSSYLNTLDVVGACVEAVPSRVLATVTANLFIEPSGEVHLRSVVEPLLAPAFTEMGCCFPCSSPIPYDAVREASLTVGRAAFRKRVFGYMSIDFVLFEKPNPNGDGTNVVRMWGVDVDMHRTNNAVAHDFAAMITHSEWDAMRGVCMMPETGKELKYVYSGIIYNPFISGIRHTAFFTLCRSKGVSYDRERHSGAVFHLLDVLLRGCLGVLVVGPDMQRVVRRMSDFQSLLNLELPKQGEHSSESNFVYFSSNVRQLARLSSNLL